MIFCLDNKYEKKITRVSPLNALSYLVVRFKNAAKNWISMGIMHCKQHESTQMIKLYEVYSKNFLNRYKILDFCIIFYLC